MCRLTAAVRALESSECGISSYRRTATPMISLLPNSAVILLDWSGVDLTPKPTPYAEKAVELQDSNMAPDQIYIINSKS